MIEIHSTLYVGSDADVDEFKDMHPDGFIIHAAKDPWHRQACGYTGRAAPQNSNYYAKSGEGYLALNLVDSPDKKYIAKKCFDYAHADLEYNYGEGIPTLLHCNQGKSRSAGILFYHMMLVDIDVFAPFAVTFEEAVDYFEAEIYPDTEFGNGVRGFLEDEYNAMLDGGE